MGHLASVRYANRACLISIEYITGHLERSPCIVSSLIEKLEASTDIRLGRPDTLLKHVIRGARTHGALAIKTEILCSTFGFLTGPYGSGISHPWP